MGKSRFGPNKGIVRKGERLRESISAGRSRPTTCQTSYTATDLLSQILDGNVSEFEDLSSDDNDENDDETIGLTDAARFVDDDGDIVMESDESEDETAVPEPDTSSFTYTWRKNHLENENCKFEGSFSDPPWKAGPRFNTLENL